MSGPAAGVLLSPLAWLYGLVVRLRNYRYDRGGASRTAGIPVLSVGNLTVGGTGKTPLVRWLVRQLTQRGFKTAVVSRGYRGRAGKGPLIVSEGDGPLVSAERCGDEPYMLARTTPGVMVIVGSDRLAGVRAAAAGGSRIAVLDDGFQHRRLARDLDIVLLDGRRPFGGRRLLPAGSLREPLSSLKRADIVVATRCDTSCDLEPIEHELRLHNSKAPLLRSAFSTAGFVDLEGDVVPAPRRALAFCAIGNPSSFRDDLERLGLEIAGFRAFRDHHRFARDQLQRLQREAERCDATPVTTEKDLARLLPLAGLFETRPPVALRIVPEISDSGVLLDAVTALFPEERR